MSGGLCSCAARQSSRKQRGGAVVEFALVALMMIIFVFGIIDFGLAIHEKQIITHLTREGANLAARSTNMSPLTEAANAVVAGASPLNLNTDGYVVITAVTNTNGRCSITGQVGMGGKPSNSRIGKPGDKEKNLHLPQPCRPNGAGIPQNGQTMYVAEVFYQYKPLTPVGSLLNLSLNPLTLYDAAYF